MSKYTIEELEKLKKYMLENAEKLVNTNQVRRFPKYPKRDQLNSYKYTVVEIPSLGRVEIYFTSESNVLKIEDTLIDSKTVIDLNFSIVEEVIVKHFKNKEIDDKKTFFENL